MNRSVTHPTILTTAALGVDRVLDTVGLYCPIPIVRTGEAIRGMERGQRLEILSDDRVILIDLPAWCRAHGHEYEGASEEEGVWRLRVRKAGRGTA
ncbi:MAG TPA: sulfurtransferase TusA family protein [Verrucomicrobiae bacterium]|nr:sulfurtransferase TusA family protein [Verrucomicrobiae bacterium]